MEKQKKNPYIQHQIPVEVFSCSYTFLFFTFRISPIGISSVICAKILSVAKLGVVMSQLAMFIITVVSGIFLYQFTILQIIYVVFVRKNPFRFWWGLFQSWMTAFATAST